MTLREKEETRERRGRIEGEWSGGKGKGEANKKKEKGARKKHTGWSCCISIGGRGRDAAAAGLILSLRVLLPRAFHTRFVFLSPSSWHQERAARGPACPHPPHPLARLGNQRGVNDFGMGGVLWASGETETAREGRGGRGYGREQ